MDAVNIMKPALTRGNLSCIGATTIAEYRRYIRRGTRNEKHTNGTATSAFAVRFRDAARLRNQAEEAALADFEDGGGGDFDEQPGVSQAHVVEVERTLNQLAASLGLGGEKPGSDD
jgi:hypothetical protein